jgi:hypothetical protein
VSSRLEFQARVLAAKLRGLLSARQHDHEFDDEIREHLELLADRFMAQGMSGEQALRAARHQFGNTTLLHEDRRALQTLTSIEALWLDLCYAIRTLGKNRAFAAVSIPIRSRPPLSEGVGFGPMGSEVTGFRSGSSDHMDPWIACGSFAPAHGDRDHDR